MDEPHQSKSKAKPKTTLFLSCFGFSRKIQVSHKKSSKFVQDDNKRWFFRSTFLLKQSGIKTVPVDSTESEKINNKKNTCTLKKSKMKRNSDEIPPKSQNRTTRKKTTAGLKVTTSEKHQEKIILENRKLLDHVKDSPKHLSFRREIDAIRIGSSQPAGSHEAKPVHRSTSFPAPTNLKPADKSPWEENFGPVIGMSIVMLTLIILLLWGRLCAILCTCAWLYFVPKLRTQVNFTKDEIVKNDIVSDEFNFNSDEYKKRVVLEGFLERSHRFSS